MSFSLRVAIILVPLVAGVIAVKVTARLISRPSDALLFAVWLAALIIVSIVAANATQRATRRLAPLGALFKMTLVFPDEAPSRFRTALRAGSTRSLILRHESTVAGTSPEQLAAKDLVALMARLNRHDRVTRGHSERVRAYSVMLGEEIGLSRDDLDKLNWAALIHDIGKLDVPESILNKEGRPTDDEWAVEDRTGDIAKPDAPDETTTVTKPGASALGSPATTTIPASPTTTITTSQSTTTTTAPPPPPPPQAQEWLIGSGGHTTSQSYLPIDSSLAVGPLPNYDTGRDSEPGLLIQRG